MLGFNWDQLHGTVTYDDPYEIIINSLTKHKKQISGFGGNPNINANLLKEALNPIHAAISLEGEPTLYPRLGDLVNAFKENGFKTIFIVTNGTNSELLSQMKTEPSQLYVSLCAPDEQTYQVVCRPMVPRAWEQLTRTLEILNSFTCPTVLRLTLVPKLNIKRVDEYARMINFSNPTYVEPKAAMSVGFARKRFQYDEMARHKDIQEFAARLSEASGYSIIDEQWQSSIVLLSRLKKPINLYA
jgi:tRNA wybutosine-synthesizing protein 1